MKVYVLYTDNGEAYEDCYECVEGVFSSIEKVEEWFADNEYVKKEPDYSGRRSWLREIGDYGEEPLREEYDSDQEWKDEHDYWQDGIANKTPYWIERSYGWYETWEVQ